MSTRVGPKGQVVIEKEIRDRLGVEPGATAIQKLVDDHVEIHFIPPIKLHNRSLFGILRGPADPVLTEEELRAATERAWDEAAREEWEKWQAQLTEADK